MSNYKKESIAIRTLLALLAEEAYEELGNDDEQVHEYMEIGSDVIYSRLRDLIPQAMADYRFDNDPSERGL
tara:strand:+ start:478 stop:690 length:213 start_codon:yes stop_codon:yes gene_type:complete